MSDDIGTESERNPNGLVTKFLARLASARGSTSDPLASELRPVFTDHSHRGFIDSGHLAHHRATVPAAARPLIVALILTPIDHHLMFARSQFDPSNARTTHERPTNEPRTSHERPTNDPRTSIVPPIRRSVHPMTALTALTASTASDLQMPPHPKHSPCSIP